MNKAIAPGKALEADDSLRLVAHPATGNEKVNLVEPYYPRSNRTINTCIVGIAFSEEARHRKRAYREDISNVTLESVMNELYRKYGQREYCEPYNTRNETHRRALERYFKEEYPEYADMHVFVV